MTPGEPGPATVDGFEALTTTNVTLPPSAAQAELLGLREDTSYEIQGVVREVGGEPVELPTTLAYTGIPLAGSCRWGHRPFSTRSPSRATDIAFGNKR